LLANSFSSLPHFVTFNTLNTPFTPPIPITLLLFKIYNAEILSPVLK